MPEPNTIEVSIVARTSSYVEALKESAAATGTTATAIQSNLSRIGSSAQEAHNPMSRFSDLIKNYAQEERQQGRLGSFLAKQIGEIGIAGKGASGAVAQLISAFAFGGGISVGTELVKLTIHAFTELTAEEAKAKAELKELADSAVEYGKKMKEHVEDVLAGLRGETQSEAIARKEVLPLLRQEAEAHARIAAAKSNRQLAEKQEAIDEMQAMARLAQIAQADEELKKAEAELKAIESKIADARKAVSEVGGAERGKADKEADEEAKKRRDQQAIDEAKYRADEIHEWKRHYDERTAIATKAVEEIFAAQEKEALDEAKLRGEELRDYKKHYDEVTAETTRALKEIFDEEDRAKKKKADAALQEQKKLQHAAESTAKSMGDAYGAAFAGMLTGSQTVAAGMKAIMKATLKAIIDLAIASITASAAKAEGEAIASQAGIPIVGPALAVAAAAALGATVMGLIDTLPSAAGGYDIPTMSNPVVQAHGGEMILPRDIADPLRASLDGAGAAEEHLHVHVHGAIDGDSVRRVVHSEPFVRALRDARRTGRMP